MLKKSQNPPVLWPRDQAINEMAGYWWAVHVKPRQEKALAREIVRGCGGYFLPMYEKALHSKGRSWRSLVVLFPGYLFFCGGEPDRIALLSTGRAVRLIPVPDRDRFVRELSAIERMIDNDMPIGPVSKLTRGRPCRIIDGPLAGSEGVVERRQGRRRFVVMVSMLGQGAAVEVDAESLEPLDR